MRIFIQISIVFSVLLVALTLACSSPTAAPVEPTTNIDATGAAKVGRVPAETPATTPALKPASPPPTLGPKPTPEPESTRTVAGQDNSWTVLVYIMADTDLEEEALHDLLELEEVVGDKNTNIVVLIDRSSDPNYSDSEVLGLGNFSDTKLLNFGADGIGEWDESGELNMGDSETLESFIAFSLEEFPADNTALILWDHGAGWTGMGPDEGDGDDLLTLPELRSAIINGLSEVGLNQFDLIGMDACLMATYEVAHAVNGLTRYLLASEELEPGHGWDYRSFATLLDQSAVQAADLGIALTDGFERQAKEAETFGDITLSLLDMDHFDQFTKSFRAILSDAEVAPESPAPHMRTASTRVPKYGSSPNPSMSTHYIDLAAFVTDWFDWNPILLEDFKSALDNLVVYKIAGPANERSTGLSIYFPSEEAYSKANYFDDPIHSQWANFLQEYLTAGAELPEESYPRIDPDSVEYEIGLNGIDISAVLEPGSSENVAEVNMYYGVVDPSDGELYYIGEEEGYFDWDEQENFVSVLYDFSILSISDGENEIYAFSELWWEDELMFVDVPLAYVPPEEFGTDDPAHYVILSLGLDEDGTVFNEVFYSVDEYGQWGEISLEPYGILSPLVQMWDEESDELYWVDSDDESALWADKELLQYSYSPLPAGLEVWITMEVSDFGGNSDWIEIATTAPEPTVTPDRTSEPTDTPGPSGATSFSDGTWVVGEDILPGTYRSSNSGSECYWERLNGFSGEMEDVITNEITNEFALVEISSTDAGFSSVDCGTWMEATAPITSSSSDPFDDGWFIVGLDIAPGTWRSPGGDDCYWARLSGFSGDNEHIEANELGVSNNIVTIQSTDQGFYSQNCGTWTRQSPNVDAKG